MLTKKELTVLIANCSVRKTVSFAHTLRRFSTRAKSAYIRTILSNWLILEWECLIPHRRCVSVIGFWQYPRLNPAYLRSWDHVRICTFQPPMTRSLHLCASCPWQKTWFYPPFPKYSAPCLMPFTACTHPLWLSFHPHSTLFLLHWALFWQASGIFSFQSLHDFSQ